MVSLANQGVDKHLADRARKAAAMPEAKFEEQVVRAVKVAVAATKGDAAVVKEARRAQQDVKKNRRAERERELADKIRRCRIRNTASSLPIPNGGSSRGRVTPAWTVLPTTTTRRVHRSHRGSRCPVDRRRRLRTVPVGHRPDLRTRSASWQRGALTTKPYIWGKDKVGTGLWNREKHELLLIGTRGNVPCPAPGTQWNSLIIAPRGKHSVKPECFLDMIERYFPTLPKIELNRRGAPRPGWDAWGMRSRAPPLDAG